METARRSGRVQCYGTWIVMRDILIFLALLLCFALLYRVSPALFRGASGVNVSVAVREAVLPEPQPEEPASVSAAAENAVPTLSAAEDAAIAAPTADPAGAETAEAAAAPDAAALEAPAVETPAQPAPVGDFSAAFPATDTGLNALHSFQSDDLRIAVTKVSENGVVYFVADVWVRTLEHFKTALAKGEYGRNIREMPARIAAEAGAVLAVSGDYYGARDRGAVVRNGQLYRDVMSDDVCILRTDGTLDAYGAGEFSSLQSLDETVWQAWAFGPALVRGGTACDASASKIKGKNPRCAIGYYEPGHYCFIVADGRQEGYSTGMTLGELSNAFVALGCEAAYNLDGGATAMMVFNGEVVNRPTNGGRSSSDIICF